MSDAGYQIRPTNQTLYEDTKPTEKPPGYLSVIFGLIERLTRPFP